MVKLWLSCGDSGPSIETLKGVYSPWAACSKIVGVKQRA